MILVGRRVGVGGLAIDVRVCACVGRGGWVSLGQEEGEDGLFLIGLALFLFFRGGCLYVSACIRAGIGVRIVLRSGRSTHFHRPPNTNTKHTQKQLKTYPAPSPPSTAAATASAAAAAAASLSSSCSSSAAAACGWQQAVWFGVSAGQMDRKVSKGKC